MIAVNHKQAGVLAWVIGDRSAATFKRLWLVVKCWHFLKAESVNNAILLLQKR